jgi:hypothetical protein
MTQVYISKLIEASERPQKEQLALAIMDKAMTSF